MTLAPRQVSLLFFSQAAPVYIPVTWSSAFLVVFCTHRESHLSLQKKIRKWYFQLIIMEENVFKTFFDLSQSLFLFCLPFDDKSSFIFPLFFSYSSQLSIYGIIWASVLRIWWIHIHSIKFKKMCNLRIKMFCKISKRKERVCRRNYKMAENERRDLRMCHLATKKITSNEKSLNERIFFKLRLSWAMLLNHHRST